MIYECASLTVPKGTGEAAAVEKYNESYEYITKGAGKNRRTSDAEVQTENLLVKSRSANTERIKKEDKGSFVSNFEMFDTYTELAKNTKQLDLDGDRRFEITSYVREGMENIDEMLAKNENFSLSSMILQRLLAGNVYCERQKRFRNMVMPDPLDLNVKYLYRLETLFSYKSSDTMGKDVVDMSWCCDNGDLLAVAYGGRSFNFLAIYCLLIHLHLFPKSTTFVKASTESLAQFSFGASKTRSTLKGAIATRFQ